ncbi:phosphatidylinositol 3-kinase C2 domain-containing subunit gamma [Pseudophryne corroboree]|uniref:phosphatidylinositol 3-kinase C2 domain-containing subunit gamma n=1 Tax=Pseudophryne corroboree TaxID=495146 RepID=UPI003081D4A7
MEPGFNIGFMDHVTNPNSSEQFPQSSSSFTHPGAGHRAEDPCVGGYDSSPLGQDSAVPDRSNVQTLCVPYGFITNNWIEEQQSWFPLAPEEETTDPTIAPELPNPPNFVGFRIGFESYGGVNYSDPSVHYHHIDHQRCIAPPHVSTWTPARRHTVTEDTWPGYENKSSEDRSHIRRASLYDVHGHSPQYPKPTTTDWKIKLLETSLGRETSFPDFCKAVKLIRSRFCASDRSSNPGRIWSVAISFPEDVADTEIEIYVFSDSLQTPLHIAHRDSVRVEDLIADIFHNLHHPAPQVPPYHPAPQVPPYHPAPQVPPHHPAPQVPPHHPAPQVPPYHPALQVPPHHPTPQVPPYHPAPQVPPYHPAPQVPPYHYAPQVPPYHYAPQVPPYHPTPEVPPHHPTPQVPPHSSSIEASYVFAPSNHHYAPQIQYSGHQYPYSASQNQYSGYQYSATQNQYSGHQFQYLAPQGEYSASHNQYSMPQYQYSASQNLYPSLHGQYSAHQDQYSAPQDRYSVPQDRYSAPQDRYSAPQDRYSAPQDQYPTLHGQYSAPQDQYSAPQSLYPSLQDLSPLQQSQHSPSQPLYPSLQDSLLQSLEPSGRPQDPAPGNSFLSICGFDEYLQMGYSLRSHTHLQRLSCVRLRLHIGGDTPALARTAEDDQEELNLSDRLEHAQYWGELRKSLFSAVSFYEDQVRHFLQNQHAGVGNVLESVKEICYLLRSVETKEITNAVQKLSAAMYLPAQSWTQPPNTLTPEQSAVMELSRVISQLINTYSRSFHTDFQAVTGGVTCAPDTKQPHLSFHLYAAHNLPERWATSDNSFSLSCSVTYAGRKICPEVKTRNVPATKSFFSMVIWNEMITFPVPVATIPYESMLVLRLCAVSETSPGGSFLAWSCLPLYSDQQIVHGSLLLNMVSHVEPPPVITPAAFDVSLPSLMTVQVDFPESDHTFQRPVVVERTYSAEEPYDDPGHQLEFLSHRNSVLLLSQLDKQSLWHYRRHPNMPRNILPLVLGSAPSWDPPSISAMYQVLKDWPFTNPLEGLGLLNSCFPDVIIREAACRQIQQLSDDELLGFLPQLVQALKFDWHLDGALVKLLLQRSMQSLQVAHRLFWLLTDAANEAYYRSFYQRILAALQLCAGRACNRQFLKQKRLLKILQDIAEKVKSSVEEKRQETLNLALSDLDRFFAEEAVCRLPQDPAIVVKGIDRDLCSYFKSNAKPLKLSFINADLQGPNIHVIFKIGDDIRQDMLVLQFVELMDRIWLHEGLDLRMITYKCLSTGRKQGLIQMVPDSTTLAKIQNKTGIFGPLKDTSMKKWFKNNKTASENFLRSCAGWCVITFILGVCDRHNDNIMLTTAGHMFHIDFGKFLGNAQMFGKVKRDRAPFIFTSEMEYFITEEGKSPHRAQEFVDLCCCAYNIIRKHSDFIINLLELMLQAGLPELSKVQDLKYVHDNLRPYDSDLKATSYFTSKITESLQCVAVKLNFLIHAFATMSPLDAARKAGDTKPSFSQFIRKKTVKGIQKIHKMVSSGLARYKV